MKDQWVPCSPDWLKKFPGACATAPRRPGRQGEGVSHYHLRDNPTLVQLARFVPAQIRRYHPMED